MTSLQASRAKVAGSKASLMGFVDVFVGDGAFTGKKGERTELSRDETLRHCQETSDVLSSVLGSVFVSCSTLTDGLDCALAFCPRDRVKSNTQNARLRIPMSILRTRVGDSDRSIRRGARRSRHIDAARLALVPLLLLPMRNASRLSSAPPSFVNWSMIMVQCKIQNYATC